MRSASRILGYLICIYSLIFLVILISSSIKFEMEEVKPISPEYAGLLETSGTPAVSLPQIEPIAPKTSESEKSGSRGSRASVSNQAYLNYIQSERFPISIIKNIHSTKIDSDYKSATFCVYTQVTNIYDKNLYNIDIYEIVPEGNTILNCSFPSMTYSIEDQLRYARKENFLFSTQDIRDPEGLARRLMTNETLSCYLRDQDSRNIYGDLKIALINKNKTYIKQIIAKSLNDLIVKTDLAKCIKINETMLPAKLYPLDEMNHLINISMKNEMQSNDRKLLNFLLLRDIYAIYIGKPNGNLKIMDGRSIDENAGLIHIPLSIIHPKESLMFRYYYRTSEYGTHQTTTVARIAGNKFPDYVSQKEVQFSAPRFFVQVDPSKFEAKPKMYIFDGDNIEITYNVELLDPLNATNVYEFNGSIEKDKNIIIDGGETSFPISFRRNSSKLQPFSKTINISFKEEGVYDIPSLIIDDYTYYKPGIYIKSEHWYSKHILEISLFVTIFIALFSSPPKITKRIKRAFEKGGRSFSKYWNNK
ncbi:MAG: hypothetical protein A4E49_01510 [Methanosaeta sp. PtaU1.Bin112]|nr:MAG: hypothetical protein A4E49_01510 [Methanosaeta sp. PtaU1.Bin112]